MAAFAVPQPAPVPVQPGERLLHDVLRAGQVVHQQDRQPDHLHPMGAVQVVDGDRRGGRRRSWSSDVGGVEAGQGAQRALDLGFRLDLIGHRPTPLPSAVDRRLHTSSRRSWHGPASERGSPGPVLNRADAARGAVHRFRATGSPVRPSPRTASASRQRCHTVRTGYSIVTQRCRISTCDAPLKTLPFPVVCERPHMLLTSETEVGRVTYRPAKKFTATIAGISAVALVLTACSSSSDQHDAAPRQRRQSSAAATARRRAGGSCGRRRPAGPASAARATGASRSRRSTAT